MKNNNTDLISDIQFQINGKIFQKKYTKFNFRSKIVNKNKRLIVLS